MNPIILIGCFTPLVVIFIVMKFAVWVSAVNAEQDYVRKEPLRKRGPYLEDAYADCLLYTSPSPRDLSTSRMPSSA